VFEGLLRVALLIFIFSVVNSATPSLVYASEGVNAHIIESHKSTYQLSDIGNSKGEFLQLSPLPRGVQGVFLGREKDIQNLGHHSKTSLVLSKSQLHHVSIYQQALILWSSSNLAKRTQALKSILAVSSEMDPELRSSLKTEIVILRMLLAQEQYSKVRECARKFVSDGDAVSQQLLSYRQWHIDWVVADSYYKQHKVDEALSRYNDLLLSVDTEANPSTTWILNKAHIRMLRATVMMLSGYASGDADVIDSAQVEAEKSERIAIRYDDFRLAGQAANIRGLTLSLQNNLVESELAYYSSIELHEKAGASRDISAPWSNLSDLYRIQGRLNRAIDTATAALAIEQQYSRKSDIAQIRLNLAELYIEVGKLQAAIEMAKDASIIFEKAEHWDGLANSYFQHAVALRHTGSLTAIVKAIDLNKAALSLLGFYDRSGTDVTSHVRFLVELARSYHLSNQPTKLREVQLEIKKIVSNGFQQDLDGFASSVIESRLLLAGLALAEKNTADYSLHMKALEELLMASDVDQSSRFVPKHLAAQLEFLELRVRYLRDYGSLTSILDNARKLNGLLKQGSRQLDPTFLGPSWTQKVSRVMDIHFAALFANEGADFSASFWEQVLELKLGMQSRLVRLARSDQGLSQESEPNHYRSLTILSNIEKQLLQTTDKALRSKKRADLNDAKIALSTGRYSYGLTGTNVNRPWSKKIKLLQGEISTNTLALVYHISEEASFCISISHNSIDGQMIDSSLNLSQVIVDYSAQLESQSNKYLSTSTQLSTDLGLNKIDFKRYSKLIIQPSGSLYSLPINSLSIAGATESYKPLGSVVNLVLTFSVEDYLEVYENVKEVEYLTDIAIFANPTFGEPSRYRLVNEPVKANRQRFRSWSSTLDQLPWTSLEANSIKDLYSNQVVKLSLEERATASNLISESMRKTKILHIASHGYFDPSTPDLVGIATAQTNNESEQGFGFVSLTRLIRSRQFANLVVVSGCETARGMQYFGEGVNSFSRGFLIAGAGSVLGSLWKVPDRPTAEFMKIFYRFLKDSDGDAGEALRKTRHFFSRHSDFKHPFFWAGFELTSFNRAYDQAVFN